MNSNQTIRLRTTPGDSQNIQVKIQQEFDTLDFLSLKITQEEAYRNFCSDYGVIAGRVVANDGFGVENAKVSVFIPLSDEDANNPKVISIYPYTTPNELNGEGVRYNLLPRDGKDYYVYEKIPATDTPTTYWNNPDLTSQGSFAPGSSWTLVSGVFDDGTQVWRRLVSGTHGPSVPVGTMPSKLSILDNDVLLDVFDKYYRLSTTTNRSGDYMIFGVPVGNQTVHMDVDLSDAGQSTLNVQDFLNIGYPQNLFNGPNFKSSTNLDSLPQIESRNISVEVVPFWGNLEQCEVGITRLDISLNKVITPSASIIAQAFTNGGNLYLNDNGNNIKNNASYSDYANINNMMLHSVNVLAIQWDGASIPFKTESFDGNIFMSLPMNRDRFITNEFGDTIPSPDGIKGIPTTAEYKFEIWDPNSLASGNVDQDYKTSKYLTNWFKLRYDLDGKRKMLYTFGNTIRSQDCGIGGALISFGCSENDGAGYGSILAGGVNSDRVKYPASFNHGLVGFGDPAFGEGATCYGSLYFPRYQVKNGNNGPKYASGVAGVPEGGDGDFLYIPSGPDQTRLYISAIMDITEVAKMFRSFSSDGQIVTPTSQEAANFVNPQKNGFGADVNLGGAPENQININDYSLPLRHSSGGDAVFPNSLDTLDSSLTTGGDTYSTPYNTTITGIVTSPSLRPIPTPQNISRHGRYFMYFGLFKDNNALTYAKKELGV